MTTSIFEVTDELRKPTDLVIEPNNFVIKVNRQDHFIDSCLRIFHIYNHECSVRNLSTYENEYETVSTQFFTSNPWGCSKRYDITGIQEVVNPYLLLHYELMKSQYNIRYGNVNEMLLFHGTTATNQENIVQNNFDWRLKGKF